MTSISRLPCETIAVILASLNHPDDLKSALLTCRHFYAAFKEVPGIEISVIQRQITPALLPYVVTLARIWSLKPMHSPRTDAARPLLDELHDHPKRLSARFATLPRDVIRCLSLNHDVIHELAIDFSLTALSNISSSNPPRELSPSEYFRFCQGFYRFELCCALSKLSNPGPFEEEMYSWYFLRHAPWENEQLACVYQYLQARFSKACHKVASAHMSEWAVWGTTIGRMPSFDRDENWTQHWIEQGVIYVHRTLNAPSDNEKFQLLRYGGFFCWTTLAEKMRRAYKSPEDPDMVSRFNLPVSAWSEEELRQLCRRQQGSSSDSSASRGDRPWEGDGDEQDQDVDLGPFSAWRDAHQIYPLAESVVHPESFWLRERAYVFWDETRVKCEFGPHGFGEKPRSLRVEEEKGSPASTVVVREEKRRSFWRRLARFGSGRRR